MYLTPKEISEAQAKTSTTKAFKSFDRTFLLGILGGIFISLGALGSIVMYAYVNDVGIGKFLGGAVFSIALLFVVISGGEFFTGNNLITLGLFNKQFGIGKIAKNWIAVFIGNFIGALGMVAIIYGTGLLQHGSENVLSKTGEVSVHLAEMKTRLTFIEALTRGILCNLLVAGAVWMQTAATEVSGKVWTIFFPIVAFIVSGFEHVVANMFYIPTGMAVGASVSTGSFLIDNILPVALGNIISGGLMIPGLYYLVYLRK